MAYRRAAHALAACLAYRHNMLSGLESAVLKQHQPVLQQALQIGNDRQGQAACLCDLFIANAKLLKVSRRIQAFLIGRCPFFLAALPSTADARPADAPRIWDT